jgi:hypothetical protein
VPIRVRFSVNECGLRSLVYRCRSKVRPSSSDQMIGFELAKDKVMMSEAVGARRSPVLQAGG